ncbi:hypothetical protein [Streptomyces sp. NPDC048361]|uniref:hypothetical protein n=1 Tax=Streptomyces sp. NPDC048361 TaxID=3154720 RepID=UPI00342877E9
MAVLRDGGLAGRRAGRPVARVQDEAIAVYEQGGALGEAPRAKAVRFAALSEGEGFGYLKAALRIRPERLPR